jgi:hypothetical protein
MMIDMNEDLMSEQVAQTATRSARGLLQFPILYDTPPGLHKNCVQVSESSAAFAPSIWLDARHIDNESGQEIGVFVHLSLKDAKTLRDQIDYLVKNHYQVV